MAVAERKTAEERREQILEAALVEFAARGLEGGSTESIARAVGISQPYVFRLFGTKKELFIATIERCMLGTLEMFRTASAGLSGEEALRAIGEAYSERLAADPTYLRSQMQAYAASDDPQIRDVIVCSLQLRTECIAQRFVPDAQCLGVVDEQEHLTSG